MTKSRGKRIIKAWAVVWDENTMGARVDSFLSVDCRDETKDYTVKCNCHPKKWHFLDSFAIFEHRKEAKSYQDDNPQFKIIPIQIILPSKKSKRK